MFMFVFVRGSHLSNATCLARAFFKSGDMESEL